MANQWVVKFIPNQQVAPSTKMISKCADAREREHFGSVVLYHPGLDFLSPVWQLANSINFFLAEQERDQQKVNVVLAAGFSCILSHHCTGICRPFWPT